MSITAPTAVKYHRITLSAYTQQPEDVQALTSETLGMAEWIHKALPDHTVSVVLPPQNRDHWAQIAQIYLASTKSSQEIFDITTAIPDRRSMRAEWEVDTDRSPFDH